MLYKFIINTDFSIKPLKESNKSYMQNFQQLFCQKKQNENV